MSNVEKSSPLETYFDVGFDVLTQKTIPLLTDHYVANAVPAQASVTKADSVTTSRSRGLWTGQRPAASRVVIRRAAGHCVIYDGQSKQGINKESFNPSSLDPSCN